MKSSNWTLCLAALLICFTSGISKDLEKNENFVDSRNSIERERVISGINNFLFKEFTDEEGEETECPQDLSKCKSTSGNCFQKGTGPKECICPDGEGYMTDLGCTTRCLTDFLKCTATGGNCFKETDKPKECVCPTGDSYVTDKGCTTKCSDNEACDNTGGRCLKDEDKPEECFCPPESNFVRGQGCTIKCLEENLKCEETGGKCYKKGDEPKECVCPIGDKYIIEKGCTTKCTKNTTCENTGGRCLEDGVKPEECVCPTEDRYIAKKGCTKKCSEGSECDVTGGRCLKDGEKPEECVCPIESTLVKGKGCTIKCLEENLKCEETGGKCYKKGDEPKECVCAIGDKYIPDKGCTKKCSKNRICDDTGGRCINDGEKTEECVCPDGSTFVKGQGCTVECLDDKPKCEDTGGQCYQKTNKAKQCVCPDGGSYITNRGCTKKCSEDTKICETTGGKCLNKEPEVCACPLESTFVEGRGCLTPACKEKCGESSDVDCKGVMTNKDKIQCVCKNEKEAFHEEEQLCKPDLCWETCGVANNSKGDEICENGPFAEKGEIQCKCRTKSKKFDIVEKDCRVPCSSEKNCFNKADCIERDDTNKFCDCLEGTSGDKCQIVTDCVGKGKWSKCKGNKGTCKFDETDLKAVCECKAKGQKPSEKMGFCVDTCEDEKKCSGNRICDENKHCVCKPGYDGDGCTFICPKDQDEICKKAGATCVYTETAPYATCKCKEGYTFKDSKCLHGFCSINPCLGESECEFNEKTNIGQCKCAAGKYYDYKAQKCSEPDKCLLKKEKCKINEECVDGVCKCPYETDDKGQCKKKDCDSASCFPGAECVGKNCVCKKGKIYVNNECTDATCIFDNFKKKCECPDGFEREENKECVPRKDSGIEKCSKDCGYGLCYKEEGKELCRCFDDHYVTGGEETKCVLSKDACASGKVSEDSMTCNCSGIYRQAEDKITCALITCDDSSKLCDATNAVCKMRWKDIPSNWKLQDYCVCPKGYIKDKSLECKEPCSTDNFMHECMKKNQFCYSSKLGDETPVPECRCPPPFKDKDGSCQEVYTHAYLIKNIPIMKAKYVTNNNIDSVLLKGDIIDSLKQTYGADIFDYGYLHDFQEDGDVLKCTVWILFKEDPGVAKDRIFVQMQTFTKEACKEENDCNLNLMIWPPSIVLSGSKIEDVSFDNLTFCSFTKNQLCGHIPECKDGKECTCPSGSRGLRKTFYGGDYVVQSCEDIDECTTIPGICPENTECLNLVGGHECTCKPGFKKSTNESDKGACVGLCSTSPCKKGVCSVVNDTVSCKCELGYAGSFCDTKDVNLASAKKQVVVVGAVLGTILGVALIGFLVFYRKWRGGQ